MTRSGSRSHAENKLDNLANAVSKERGQQREQESQAVVTSPYPLLQQGGLTPEQLAVIQQSLTLPTIPLDGSANHSNVDLPTFGVEPLPTNVQSQIDVMAGMNPEELQAILTGQVFISTAPLQVKGSTGAESYKNWWDEKDEEELVRLIEDQDYRSEKFGFVTLEWSLLVQYFKRSEKSLRKKYWLLKRNNTSRPGQHAPEKRRKTWGEKETEEMKQIVNNRSYRINKGIENKEGSINWKLLADYFQVYDVQTVQRKFRNILKSQEQRSIDSCKTREHHRKKIAYKWMIVTAMKCLPNQEGTAPQIFELIEANEEFASQLDTRISPGTKHVDRWKIQVRKNLSSQDIFVNTGRKSKHETIWMLNTAKVDEVKSRPKQRTGQGTV